MHELMHTHIYRQLHYCLLQELYAVFADVCDSLKLRKPKHHMSDTCEYSTLSAKQMAGLLRKWLLKDPNRKVIMLIFINTFAVDSN